MSAEVSYALVDLWPVRVATKLRAAANNYPWPARLRADLAALRVRRTKRSRAFALLAAKWVMEGKT